MPPPSGHRAKHDLISRRAQRGRTQCLYCDHRPSPTQSLPSPHVPLWVISRHPLRAGKLLVQVSSSWSPAGARSPPETVRCGLLASPPPSKYKNQTLQCWSSSYGLPFFLHLSKLYGTFQFGIPEMGLFKRKQDVELMHFYVVLQIKTNNNTQYVVENT